MVNSAIAVGKKIARRTVVIRKEDTHRLISHPVISLHTACAVRLRWVIPFLFVLKFKFSLYDLYCQWLRAAGLCIFKATDLVKRQQCLSNTLLTSISPQIIFNLTFFFHLQGPCCTPECKLKFGDKCRDDNGCRDSSYCDGRGPHCPPSINKPNKTVCNDEFVCFMGVSNTVLVKKFIKT